MYLNSSEKKHTAFLSKLVLARSLERKDCLCVQKTQRKASKPHAHRASLGPTVRPAARPLGANAVALQRQVQCQAWMDMLFSVIWGSFWLLFWFKIFYHILINLRNGVQ